jgi:hypothetical protein
LTDKQKEVRSLIAQRILKTVSIGFIPKEIEAPEWDEETGKVVKAARITKWEMLELSIVPVPANQDSLFDSKGAPDYKSLTDIKQIIENELKAATSTKVQSLIFDKQKFTVETAKNWALDHDFRAEKVDETEGTLRLRQMDPNDFLEDSFRTIELTDGVKAVVGRLKDGKDMDEKTAQELISSIKSMATLLTSLNANAERSLSLSEKMLGMLENKAADKEPITETEPTITDEVDKGKKPSKDDEEMDEEEKKKPCKKEEDEMKTIKDAIETLRTDFEKLCGFVKSLAERVSA